METERQWYTVELRIDRYGRTTVILPNDLSPTQIRQINADLREDHRPTYDDGIVLDGLVPDINYCTTPLILDRPS
jgi:hypothetical protein